MSPTTSAESFGKAASICCVVMGSPEGRAAPRRFVATIPPGQLGKLRMREGGRRVFESQDVREMHVVDSFRQRFDR